MQHRATLWITGAFWTSLLEEIEAIAGLVPISSHLQKLNGHYHLHYVSIPSSHAINSLLDSQHAKDQPPHKFSISDLTSKQQAKLISPIKDVNECLSEITRTFCFLHPLLFPGLRVVDHFSSRIAFHSFLSSSDEDLLNTFRTSTLPFTNHNVYLIILLSSLMEMSRNPMLQQPLPTFGLITMLSINPKSRLWTSCLLKPSSWLYILASLQL